ncbi:MAG: TIM barrel protein [Candidatus Aminicenantes bacterium]|nr:TIM barrel protein [Candidatus Aminicenantes bacterium]
MNKTNRRDFIKLSGLGLAAAAFSVNSCLSEEAKAPGLSQEALNLGMASYTFREFSLEQAISMTKRLGLSRISLKSFHLPLDSSENEIKKAAALVKDAGLNLYGVGVIYMKNEQEVERAFQYAHTAGAQVIIGVPDPDLLGLVEEKVKQLDIRLAIHNHGPTDKLYPTPESAYERIKELDQRIGLCLDAGHTQRAGKDPAASALQCKDRLLDVHIKDVTQAAAAGTTCEIGRGVINIPRLIKTLIKIDYRDCAALEFEKDGNDPLPGAAESIGFLKGVLEVI